MTGETKDSKCFTWVEEGWNPHVQQILRQALYDSDSFICPRRSSKVLAHEFFSLNNYQIHDDTADDTVDTYVMQVVEDISENIHMLITLSWEFALAELNPTILLVYLP